MNGVSGRRGFVRYQSSSLGVGGSQPSDGALNAGLKVDADYLRSFYGRGVMQR